MIFKLQQFRSKVAQCRRLLSSNCSTYLPKELHCPHRIILECMRLWYLPTYDPLPHYLISYLKGIPLVVLGCGFSEN